MTERDWLAEQSERSHPSCRQSPTACSAPSLRRGGGLVRDHLARHRPSGGRPDDRRPGNRPAAFPRYERLALRAIGISQFVWLCDAQPAISP